MPTRFPKWKLVLFALLSVCDFVITYLLLSRSQGRVYESNPVADEWLRQGGWLGLAAFKAVIVIAVSIIAVYVYYRRPRIAHDLLAVACGAVVVAVVTGTSIAMTKAEPASAEAEEPFVPNQFAAHSPRRPPVPKLDYGTLLDEVSQVLAFNETDLAHAVARLRKSGQASDAAWLESLRQAYPGMEDRTLLACDLMQHTIGMRIRHAAAQGLARRLESEFFELYGVKPNLPYRQMLVLSPKSEAGRKVNRGIPIIPVR